ncbi:DUF647 domain protein [Blumeria hordei DH14]|uniref:DUF647 domain protein n=1 Tax=Blumeria graminis f. sp. hordei (strain DH14) TaxID=546991 RepID=N1JD93_BLUG1|nr:DUF647 domain protein [Blumeria hordei DH14]
MPKSSENQYFTISERNQANDQISVYRYSPGESGRIDTIVKYLNPLLIFNSNANKTPVQTHSYSRTVLNAFLPAGYPNSVTDDYLRWLISPGIGVGDSNASPTTVLLLSVLHESMGRITTILFAHRLGTSLEPECKMYRLAADVFIDSALIIECLSPTFPKAWRVVLFSLASMLRSLCGVAAGSSKASLSAHFATQDNIGELNAKDSSQETVISLIGMLAGSVVVSHVTSKWTSWVVLSLLLVVHLFTNYLAVRAVCMRTFNRQRANLFLSVLIDNLRCKAQNDIIKDPKSTKEISISTQDVCSPRDIMLHERIFEWGGVLRWKGTKALGYCKLGVSLKSIFDSFGRRNDRTGSTTGIQAQKFQELLHIYKASSYILWYDEPSNKYLVVIKSHTENEVEIQLKAWTQALCLAKFGLVSPEEPLIDALRRTRNIAECVVDMLISSGLLRDHGWNTQQNAMEIYPGFRATIDENDKF